MPSFFPRHTTEFRLEEPAAFRQLSFSLVEMALVTGVVLRLVRVLALGHASSSWWFVGGAYAVAIFVLVGMATAHLANYPIRQWSWRAPAFAVLETAAEAITSAALITVGRERLGTARATWHDWPAMVTATLAWRLVVIALWTLLLAAAVTLVRRVVAARRRRTHADEGARTTGEHDAPTTDD